MTQFASPAAAYDVWHDRAVFHFLTNENDRRVYLQNLRRALKPGGHFILGTFAEDGPAKCSGLDVERYDLHKMIDTVGTDFTLVGSTREQHHTPFETTQSFLYGHFRYDSANA